MPGEPAVHGAPAAEVERGEVPGVGVVRRAAASCTCRRARSRARPWAPPRARSPGCARRFGSGRRGQVHALDARARWCGRPSTEVGPPCSRSCSRPRSSRPATISDWSVALAPLLEHGLLADHARSPSRLRRPPVDDHVHRVGVVGDRHVVAAHHGRGGARARVHLPRLRDPGVVVLLAPGDRRRAVRRRVEAVERLLGHDVDAAVLVHRERVRDLLAGRCERTAPVAGST